MNSKKEVILAFKLSKFIFQIKLGQLWENRRKQNIALSLDIVRRMLWTMNQ